MEVVIGQTSIVRNGNQTDVVIAFSLVAIARTKSMTAFYDFRKVIFMTSQKEEKGKT